MNIDKYEDTIKNCRFCFMCRHLAAVANVSFREADTPRVRAAMLDAILRGAAKYEDNPDLTDVLYSDDLSGACKRNCVSHYDETGLVLAARRDIVSLGLEPESVKKLAAEFEKSESWTVSGSGDTVFFEDLCTAETPSVAKSFEKIMKSAKVPFQLVRGGCVGKALHVLGYEAEAKKAAKKFAAFVNKLGAKTLVTANPAAYDAFVNDFPGYGAKLNLKVVHTSEFLLDKKFVFTKKAPAVYEIPSDWLRNYNNLDFPGKLLAKLGAKTKMFGTNDEESCTAGEAALVLPRIHPDLAEKLAVRVESMASDPKKDRLVTASPYTREVLTRFTDLSAVTLEELAAACL